MQDKKINLMFVNLNLGMGGIETLILEIGKRLDRNRYSPMLCVLEKGEVIRREFEQAQVPIYVIERKKQGFDIMLPFRLSALLKRLHIDIVHTHNHSVWLYGGLAATIARLPLVHTEHTSPDYNQERWAKIERYLSYITKKITTVSKSVGAFMIKAEHIEANKIEVIYNGIDCNIYEHHFDREAKRKGLNIAASDLIVGNVARFFPNKDHACLLKAFRIISHALPQAKLLIAGDGPLKESLFALREELRLQEKVHFLGNRRDIPELLKIFDVFALSSIKEGLPITILEAMASRLPVVATNVDGNPEVVVDQQTGFIVPPRNPELLAEKIISLLRDGGKRKNMGQEAHEHVKKEFSFQAMMNKYDMLYRGVVGKS